MPRRCTVCTHNKRAEIDQALVARQPFRTIADRFSVSKTALIRHHDDHLPTALVRAQEASEAAQADNLLAQVCDLRDRALGILDTAGAEEDLKAAIAAIREARGCVELLAKLAGQLKDAPTFNLILMPEWRELQAAILVALSPHAEARLAVVSALSKLESHHAPGHA